MQIINLSKQKIITTKAKFAESLTDQILGLLNPNNPKYMLFKTNFGIHTFGLKVPIDVIVMDKNYKIYKTKQDLKPNSIFFWNPKYSLVLEMPAGSIKLFSCQRGDKLQFKKGKTIL